mgnify:CR=1 FL=1
MKGKHWLTGKEASKKYGIKNHTLALLAKNGAVRTRQAIREEGQKGRTPNLYNNRDLFVYSNLSKAAQKICRNAKKARNPLGEKTGKTVKKKMSDYLKSSENVDDEMYKQTFHSWKKSDWEQKPHYNKVWQTMVNQPKHYNPGKIPVIDAIDDWNMDFSAGNVVKYLVRAGNKTGEDAKSDLLKALWYLQRLIENQG